MRVGLWLTICVLAASLLAAGCGSSDDGGDKQTFVKEANALCVKANTVAGEEILEGYDLRKVKDSNSEKEAISLEVTVFVPILIKDAEAQLAGMKELDAPSEDEEKVEEIIASYEKWLNKAKSTPLQVVIASDIFNDTRELSRKYGMVKCVKTPYEEPYVHN